MNGSNDEREQENDIEGKKFQVTDQLGYVG
jgi:hypothetical protein